MPKGIERSKGFQCKESIPILPNLSLQKNHKTFLFTVLCHSPLFTTVSSFPWALQGPAGQAFLVYLYFTGHCTVGNREYMGAGMWGLLSKPYHCLIHVDWWDFFALDKIIRHYQSNETSLAYLKQCTINFISYDFAKTNLDFLVTFQFKHN